MKKIFLLSLMLCLTVVSAWADYSYTDENGVTWGFTVEGTEATLTSVSGEGEDVIIPETVYDGETAYTVVATKDEMGKFGRYGVFYHKTIKTVKLPSTLKILGGDTFDGCSNLTSVGDLSACTSIGQNAFNGCSSLTSVGDLSACTGIAYSTFYGCSSLTSIGDLSACTQIDTHAFENCTQLEVVNLSAPGVVELTTVGGMASEQSINYFPKHITFAVPAGLVAAYRAADYWKDMPNQIIVYGEPTDYNITVEAQDKTSAIYSQIGEELLDNVLTLKLSGTINGYDIMVLRNKMHNLHHLDLSDARIVANDYQYYSGCHTEDNAFGAHSFEGVKNLVSIKLPTTITSIGEFAFYKCSSLQSIDIPEGVITIDNGAFASCI